MDEAASAAWMRPSLMHSVREALDRNLERIKMTVSISNLRVLEAAPNVLAFYDGRIDVAEALRLLRGSH